MADPVVIDPSPGLLLLGVALVWAVAVFLLVGFVAVGTRRVAPTVPVSEFFRPVEVRDWETP